VEIILPHKNIGNPARDYSSKARLAHLSDDLTPTNEINFDKTGK